MKMKFSIFLCLLPFSLSVPPPLFPPFIVHSYLSQLTPLPPLFVVRSYGIYIWNIPDLKKNEGESNHSSASSDLHNLEDNLSKQLTLNWPEPPELIQSPMLRQSKKTKVKLSTKKAYILLKVNEDKICQLSYWMGKKSTLPKRRITARFVIRLIHDLEGTGVNLNYISREEEYRESMEFQKTFNLGQKRIRCEERTTKNEYLHRAVSGVRTTNTCVKREQRRKGEQQKPRSEYVVPTLYKLTGTTDDLIQEVPLDYKELNGIDTFVLDGTTDIKIWSASLNSRKKGIALILANYINTNDRLDITRNNKIQIGSELTGVDRLIFEQEFLFQLRNKESTSKFPVYFPHAPIEQVQEKRNFLRLFMYDICGDYVCSEELLELFERPLTLTYFHPDKTYIMIDYKASHIFILTGSHGLAGILEDAMADAEQYYFQLPESELRKITIVRSTYPYPTPFIINFDEFRSFLNDEYNKTQI